MTKHKASAESATCLENISKIMLQIIPNSFMKKNVVCVHMISNNKNKLNRMYLYIYAYIHINAAIINKRRLSV